MKEREIKNMVLGTNMKEERIEDQPIWDIRCWLESLNQGEYSKVMKDGQTYADADDLFRELVGYGDYERSIEEGDTLKVVYKNGDVVKLEGKKIASKKEFILKILAELNDKSKLLSAEDLGIEEEKWNEIIAILINERLICGTTISYDAFDNLYINDVKRAIISIGGIEYLEENNQ
jgi:hypothetical protein